MMLVQRGDSTFLSPPIAPQGGLQGTISSSPAPPSEWLILQSIYARVPEPVSVQSAMVCASLEERVRNIASFKDSKNV